MPENPVENIKEATESVELFGKQVEELGKTINAVSSVFLSALRQLDTVVLKFSTLHLDISNAIDILKEYNINMNSLMLATGVSAEKLAYFDETIRRVSKDLAIPKTAVQDLYNSWLKMHMFMPEFAGSIDDYARRLREATVSEKEAITASERLYEIKKRFPDVMDMIARGEYAAAERRLAAEVGAVEAHQAVTQAMMVGAPGYRMPEEQRRTIERLRAAYAPGEAQARRAEEAGTEGWAARQVESGKNWVMLQAERTVSDLARTALEVFVAGTIFSKMGGAGKKVTDFLLGRYQPTAKKTKGTSSVQETLQSMTKGGATKVWIVGSDISLGGAGSFLGDLLNKPYSVPESVVGGTEKVSEQAMQTWIGSAGGALSSALPRLMSVLSPAMPLLLPIAVAAGVGYIGRKAAEGQMERQQKAMEEGKTDLTWYQRLFAPGSERQILENERRMAEMAQTEAGKKALEHDQERARLAAERAKKEEEVRQKMYQQNVEMEDAIRRMRRWLELSQERTVGSAAELEYRKKIAGWDAIAQQAAEEIYRVKLEAAQHAREEYNRVKDSTDLVQKQKAQQELVRAETELLAADEERRTEALKYQEMLLSAYQQRLGVALGLMQTFQLPPQMQLQNILAQTAVLRAEAANIQARIEGLIAAGKGIDSPDVIQLRTQLYQKQAEVFEKMAYARRTWLEGFTAEFIAGGVRETAMASRVARGELLGSAWYEGAILGRAAGRPTETWEQMYYRNLGSPAMQRSLVEQATGTMIGSIPDAIKHGLEGVNLSIIIDPESNFQLKGHIKEVVETNIYGRALPPGGAR